MAERRSLQRQPGRRGAAMGWMAAYAAILFSPLLLAAALHRPTDHGFVFAVGKNLGLVGFTALALQFVLSARLPWIERPFGLNVLFRFHKAMAVVALVLLLLHPVLLAAGGAGWGLLFEGDRSGHLWFARLALLVLWIHVTLSAFRAVLRLPYQTWRLIHDVAALLVLSFGFLHSYAMGEDLQAALLRAVWIVLLAVAALAFLWHRFLRRATLPRYRVREVRRETGEVWTVVLEPPAGRAVFPYLPGQFHFLVFERAPVLPIEEHHFTIASSPTETGFVASTIKESGDFTLSIGRTRPGDTALVLGPFGRFSHVLHPGERDLVFLAAGIGITPFMSMLRHMRDTRPSLRVLLIYANRAQEDIVFREELAALEEARAFDLRVVHVLSQPPEGWPGERGHLDEDKVRRLAGPDLGGKAFYLCAPAAHLDDLVEALRNAGVPEGRIHFERFSL